MSYKLVAVDLDDTLLNHDLEISKRNKRAIEEALKRGVMVTIATGRMFRATKKYALDLNLDIPLITYQGGLVRGIRSEEIYYHKPVPLNYAVELLEIIESIGCHANIYIDDNLYVKDLNEEAVGYGEMYNVPVNPVGDLREFMKEGPTKILVIEKSPKIDKVLDVLQKNYSKMLSLAKSKSFYLEITHREATKGAAVAYLAEKFRISPAEVIAIGDSFNDLSMIRYAGLGVAMGNSPEEIREQADFVTDTNDNDGVAKVIERFVL